MATRDTNKAYLVGGQLSYNCTDLTTAWPHGGTGIGLVSAIAFEPPSGYVRLPAEEDNGTRALLYVGGDAVLGCLLEQWDDDALGLIPGVTSALASGNRILTWSENSAGIVTALTNLVFTPTNVEHPGVILYKPWVEIEATSAMALSAIRWISLPLVFVGGPNDDGEVAKMGTWSELKALL